MTPKQIVKEIFPDAGAVKSIRYDASGRPYEKWVIKSYGRFGVDDYPSYLAEAFTPRSAWGMVAYIITSTKDKLKEDTK